MKEFLFSIPDTSLGDGENFYYAALLKAIEEDSGQIKRIDKFGLDHTVRSISDIVPSETVKIEGIESLATVFPGVKIISDHIGEFIGPYDRTTVHLFKASELASSFPVHTDPMHVVIWCIDGVKVMEVQGCEYRIQRNECLFMPANIPHRAINTTASIMLSVGFESTAS